MAKIKNGFLSILDSKNNTYISINLSMVYQVKTAVIDDIDIYPYENAIISFFGNDNHVSHVFCFGISAGDDSIQLDENDVDMIQKYFGFKVIEKFYD